MRRCLPCLELLALLLLAPTAFGATYHVSPSGSDDNPGTRQRPWKTLDKANGALQPGDTVFLASGQYDGVIEPTHSGREGAPITYRSGPSRAAIILGGKSRDGSLTCIRLKDREYTVIEGLRLIPRRGGWMKLDGASHCVIQDCHMEKATGVYCPIECRGCHYNRYTHLTCLRSVNLGEYGHVNGDMWNNFASSHNVFERIHISRAAHRPFGLWHDCPHNVVRECVFDCRWGRNFEFFSTPRLLMERCVITNGFEGSGSADGRAKLFVIDSIFRHNVIYRNYYGPLVISSYKWQTEDPWKMTRSRLYHNTWHRNHEYGFEMIDLGENPEKHMVSGNVFQNNVFAGNDRGGDGLALLLYSNIAEDNLFQHNLLFGSKVADKTVRYDWAFPGVSAWKGLTMTAEEANQKKPAQFTENIDADPLFLDPQSDDYRCQATSPCVDTGRPLATVLQSGSGRKLHVDDARPFYDGFNIPGERGDLVFIGPRKIPAIIEGADIDANVLQLDREISWTAGDGVSLPYVGQGPDLGAYEYGAEDEDWFAGPSIPDGLRIETMETATEPVVVVDFEQEDLEEWFYYFSFSRQRNTTARLIDSTAASGKHSMRVYAKKDQATLSCHLRPRWWNIDRFPIVRFSYRIPEDVPVGVWVDAFRSTHVGRGTVCVGGSSARKSGSYSDLKQLDLTDDDRWHDAEFDARLIRKVFPDVKLLQTFRFYTNQNGKKDQEFWFDNFQILPQGELE